MVKPIFAEAAALLADTPTAQLAAVDYENGDSAGIRQRVAVTKYPTFKPFRRGGVPLKAEYRDQRAAPAFAAFVRDLVAPPVAAVSSAEELDALVAKNRRAIVVHVDSEGHPALETFLRVARALRDDCHFLAHHGCVGISGAEDSCRTNREAVSQVATRRREWRPHCFPLQAPRYALRGFAVG
jgi:hypothetical protein